MLSAFIDIPYFGQHFGCLPVCPVYDIVEVRFAGPAKYWARWIIYLLFSSPASMPFAACMLISRKSEDIFPELDQ